MTHRLRLIVLLLALGCGQPFWNPPPPPPPEPTPAPTSAGAIKSIYLTRTACLGTCPHYHILLRADGTATYVGVTHALRTGTYSGTWSPQAYRTLSESLIRNGFFTHPELPGALDAPITMVRVDVADPTPRSKTVGGADPDYHYLWPLAQTLDSIAGTLEWHLISPDTLPPPFSLGAG